LDHRRWRERERELERERERVGERERERVGERGREARVFKNSGKQSHFYGESSNVRFDFTD